MTKAEIIEELASRRRVEYLCKRIAHSAVLTDDLKDLSQEIYLILLRQDEDKLQELVEHNALIFFIVRCILNQYRNPYSQYTKQVRAAYLPIYKELQLRHLTMQDIMTDDNDDNESGR